MYVVEQLSTGRRRALKLMLPELVENPRSRERFEQEARVASRVDSDHIVEVIAAGIDASTGAPWLAMELLEGETLGARLEREGRLTPEATLEVFRQLCHGLGAAHAAGLVHRDIKPENVYLAVPRREGVPFTLKVLDFGIAKLTEDARAAGGTTGAIGSPLWMAPEQTSSESVTPAADVWAIGLVAFTALTGKYYWRTANIDGGQLQALLREVVMEPLAPASARAAEFGAYGCLPPGFDDWFAQAVHRDPSQRFADASRAFAAFEPLLSSGVLAVSAHPSRTSIPLSIAHTAPSAAAPQKKSRAGLWLVVFALVAIFGAVLVVGGSGLIFGLWQSGVFDETVPGTTTKPAAVGAASADTASAEGVPPVASGTATAGGPETAGKGSAGGKAGAGSPPSGTAEANAGAGAATATAAASGSSAPTASAAPSASATGGDVVAMESDKGPVRDYKLSWLRDKITQCWKGNEGAQPDAGSFTASITVSLNGLGQTQQIFVSPTTYPKFRGCAVIRTSEHPFGKGPVEKKTFTINL